MGGPPGRVAPGSSGQIERIRRPTSFDSSQGFPGTAAKGSPVRLPPTTSRRQRIRDLQEDYDMRRDWAGRVADGQATVAQWEEELQRRRARFRECQAEIRWTLARAQNLTFLTYGGPVRARLTTLLPFEYRLRQRSLQKLNVVALMANSDGWEELHPEEAWVDKLRRSPEPPPSNPADRTPFPATTLEQALGRASEELEVVTRDGHRWCGQVLWDSRYAFLLKTPRGEVLILKHAVMSLAPLAASPAEWLSLDEAAAFAGLSRPAISQAGSRGQLVFRREGRRAWIARSDLEAWLQTRRTGPSPKAVPRTARVNKLPAERLTVEQAALRARLSRAALYRARAQGQLPIHREGRRAWIARADLEAWLEERQVSPHKPAPPAAPRSARSKAAPGGSMLVHRYWLRPGIPFELQLPTDLTPAEAVRLSTYLQTLPFGLPPT